MVRDLGEVIDIREEEFIDKYWVGSVKDNKELYFGYCKDAPIDQIELYNNKTVFDMRKEFHGLSGDSLYSEIAKYTKTISDLIQLRGGTIYDVRVQNSTNEGEKVYLDKYKPLDATLIKTLLIEHGQIKISYSYGDSDFDSGISILASPGDEIISSPRVYITIILE